MVIGNVKSSSMALIGGHFHQLYYVNALADNA